MPPSYRSRRFGGDMSLKISGTESRWSQRADRSIIPCASLRCVDGYGGSPSILHVVVNRQGTIRDDFLVCSDPKHQQRPRRAAWRCPTSDVSAIIILWGLLEAPTT